MQKGGLGKQHFSIEEHQLKNNVASVSKAAFVNHPFFFFPVSGNVTTHSMKLNLDRNFFLTFAIALIHLGVIVDSPALKLLSLAIAVLVSRLKSVISADILVFMTLVVLSFFSYAFQDRPLLTGNIIHFSIIAIILLNLCNGAKINTRILKVSWLSFALFILVSYYLGIDKNSIIPSMSRNGISIVSLSLLGLLFFQKIHIDLECLVWATLHFALCWFAEGRSGIISGLIILVAGAFLYFFRLKSANWIAAYAFLVTALLTIVASVLMESASDSYLLNQSYGSDPRIEMIQSYLNSFDFSSIVLGKDTLKEVPLIGEKWSGNPHNSYLRLHSSFGLLGFLILPALLINIFRLVLSGQFWLATVWLAIAVRGFSDTCLFFGILDFSFFAIPLVAPRKVGSKS